MGNIYWSTHTKVTHLSYSYFYPEMFKPFEMHEFPIIRFFLCRTHFLSFYTEVKNIQSLLQIVSHMSNDRKSTKPVVQRKVCPLYRHPMYQVTTTKTCLLCYIKQIVRYILLCQRLRGALGSTSWLMIGGYLSVVSLSPNKGPRCFIESKKRYSNCLVLVGSRNGL